VKVPGDINRNNQQLLRQTAEPGTDHNAGVWILKCRRCLNIYGSNSTDAWERKCPTCQQGMAGLAIPTERDGEEWTREEHIIAFERYNNIEFGKIHMGNPAVIELAALLGRTIGSASFKLANFSRFDPFLQQRNIKGLPHGAKGEEAIWNEFAKNPETLAFESERLLAERQGKSVEEFAQIETDDLPPTGKERDAIVRVRVNQRFFRRRVLSAYGFRCCVTGLSIRPLLIASHIVPWAVDPANRLNPRNGLCLNALHDRAFDSHLMWVEKDFTVRIALRLTTTESELSAAARWLSSFDGKRLILPNNFQPDSALLMKHEAKCLAAVAAIT
jgi:putative restriction endonuclease